MLVDGAGVPDEDGAVAGDGVDPDPVELEEADVPAGPLGCALPGDGLPCCSPVAPLDPEARELADGELRPARAADAEADGLTVCPEPASWACCAEGPGRDG